MSRTHAVWGYAFALIGASLFSLKAVLVKLAYRANEVAGAGALEPITLLALRMGFALPVYVLILVVVMRRDPRAVGLRPQAYAFMLGVLGYYMCAFLDFTGLQYITAQLERLILFTYPIVVVVIGALFFGGRFTRWSAVAIALAYAGIAIIFAGGDIAVGSNVPLGSALIAMTAFLFAMFQLFAKGLITQLGSWRFTCLAMIGAAVMILGHFTVQNGVDAGAAQLASLSGEVVLIGVAIAVFSTLLPSFLVNFAIGRIGAQSTAVLAMVGPITTILFAIWWLGEPFSWVDALGTAVTMTGIGVYTWFDKRDQIRARPLKI